MLKEQSKDDILRFHYSNDETNIIVREKKIDGKHYGFESLYLNGYRIKKFNQQQDDFDYRGMVLNTDDDDSLQACIYQTPLGKFLLLNGDNRTAGSPHMRQLHVAFLVPFDAAKKEGYLFTGLIYMPDACFVGYQKKHKRLIYLDINGDFSREPDKVSSAGTNEYIYDIYANSFDFKKGKIIQLTDNSGNRYHVKLAVPDFYDNSKYRIIESHWW